MARAVRTVDVTVSTIIDRSPADVAAYAGDPSNAPDWYANIRSVRWQTEPPVRVGSRMDFVARFLGRELAYTYEVTELVEAERLVMRTAQGPFPMQTTYTWRPVGAGTLMTLSNAGAPAGFARVARPVIATAMRRATERDLARLRHLLEGR